MSWGLDFRLWALRILVYTALGCWVFSPANKHGNPVEVLIQDSLQVAFGVVNMSPKGIDVGCLGRKSNRYGQLVSLLRPKSGCWKEEG